VSWPGGACSPVLEVGAGGDRPSHSHHGGPGYYHQENLDILRKKSCIFVHMPRNMNQSGKILGPGAFAMLSPNQIIGRSISPVPLPVSHVDGDGAEPRGFRGELAAETDVAGLSRGCKRDAEMKCTALLLCLR